MNAEAHFFFFFNLNNEQEAHEKRGKTKELNLFVKRGVFCLYFFFFLSFAAHQRVYYFVSHKITERQTTEHHCGIVSTEFLLAKLVSGCLCTMCNVQ